MAPISESHRPGFESQLLTLTWAKSLNLSKRQFPPAHGATYFRLWVLLKLFIEIQHKSVHQSQGTARIFTN